MAVWAMGSIEMILLSLDKPSTMLFSNGNAPPERPVPAPRVTIGVLLVFHNLIARLM